MVAHSRYYMARVIKFGELTTEKLIRAIHQPVSIQLRGVRYTFTDFRRFGPVDNPIGVYAKLAKYKPEGAVEVVRHDVHVVGREGVENLIEAASPFVFLPEFGGLAYKHVWNILPREQFERAFCELVEMSEKKFFVRCELEPVTDLRTFVARIAKMERVTVIQATVKPPNPLFSPCWKSLSDYVKKRRLSEVQIKEESEAGISTNVQKIAAAIATESATAAQLQEMMEPLLDGVGDAALLMAADGYGHAKVVGIEDTKSVVVRTGDNQKSFLFAREPEPEELFRAAHAQFLKISEERYLDHP